MIEEARRALRVGQRTVLFLDEIHRFNRAQQDALLPHVEAGTVTLIGATTENPSFEVIAPLLSRCRVFTLQPLDAEDLTTSVASAPWPTPNAGSGGSGVDVSEDAFAAIAHAADGDARRALGMLQTAVAFHQLGKAAREPLDPETVAEAVGQRVAAPRPRPRGALQRHLRIHQEPARQRSRCGALLPGADARRRRGPALHRQAPGDLRLGGRGQRRAQPRSRWPPPATWRSSASACPRAGSRWRRPPPTSPARRRATPPTPPSAGPPKPWRSSARRRSPCTCATPRPR